MHIDIANRIKQPKHLQHIECGASGGLSYRRRVPRVPEVLLGLVHVIGAVAFAILIADLVDAIEIKHHQRPHKIVGIDARSTAMSKLVYETEVAQCRFDPEFPVPFLFTVLSLCHEPSCKETYLHQMQRHCLMALEATAGAFQVMDTISAAQQAHRAFFGVKNPAGSTLWIVPVVLQPLMTEKLIQKAGH